ncbi:DUF6461 domain-containing protein [Nonomuraea sp. NBC_00507]|uniref:DUF6461 domain-containing protein n=1 Tax=Nonomuraea sp. NBC_00507 TaxID=2976002 RepID=UPI002E177E77
MNSLRYAYADARAYLPDDGCISWIRGYTLEDVVRIFGGDESSISPATFQEVEEEAWDLLGEEDNGESDRAVMLAARHQDWIILLEIFYGRAPDHLQAMSADGAALAVRWMQHRPDMVTYSEAGRLVADFDAGNPNSMTPHSGHQWLRALPVAVEDWADDGLATALALGEELSGVRIDREWLSRRHLRVARGDMPVRPRPFEVPFEIDGVLRPFLDSDPGLTTIARNPTPGHRHDVIKMIIDIALRYVRAETALETEALRLIASGIRNEHTERLRGDLLAEADQIKDLMNRAEQAAIIQGMRHREPYSKPGSSGDPDWAIYVPYVNGPADVHRGKQLTLLRILRLALDEDCDSTQRAAEELRALGLGPEDGMKSSLLRDLAYYITHGKNL